MNWRGHVAGLWRWMRLVRRHGRPELVCYFDGGIGDQLLCSAVARELQARRPRLLWFFTTVPELFDHNSDFGAVLAPDWWLMPWLKLTGTRVRRLSYQDYSAAEERDVPLQEPLIAALCRRAGITGKVVLRPWLPAIAAPPSGRRERPRVAVQSSCLSGRYPIANKQWPVDRMQAVVEALADDCELLQIGAPADPPLRGALDRRGEPLLATAGLLAGCDLFIGLVGFTMHLARAAECPAVIVYGGREPPELTGYSCNVNLADRPPCSPCWLYSRCDFERRCLTAITPEAVVAAARRRLAEPPARPLPADEFLISAA